MKIHAFRGLVKDVDWMRHEEALAMNASFGRGSLDVGFGEELALHFRLLSDEVVLWLVAEAAVVMERVGRTDVCAPLTCALTGATVMVYVRRRESKACGDSLDAGTARDFDRAGWSLMRKALDEKYA